MNAVPATSLADKTERRFTCLFPGDKPLSRDEATYGSAEK
ncbi:hypothetical protein Q5A_001095 [Serratia inhibens PRI-2C]|nr:hypothetical protein Q5A_001095 [Serratia inhibens PRI-2C]